jgi:hypothetical protein
MQGADRADRPYTERGTALLTVVLVMALASSLGLALVVITALEIRAAANFRSANDALCAADAGLERALLDLAVAGDWSDVLNGSTGSTFADGPAGARTLRDGRTINLIEIVNRANCGHVAACTSAELDAITDSRPWGANNPRWQLYVHGALDDLAPGQIWRSSAYVAVLVADDPSENDNDPLRDGVAGQNPGAGVVQIRSEAFGPGGAHKVIEATITRAAAAAGPPGRVRLIAWREVREPGFAP